MVIYSCASFQCKVESGGVPLAFKMDVVSLDHSKP